MNNQHTMNTKVGVLATACFLLVAAPAIAGQGNSQASARGNADQQLGHKLKECAEITNALERLVCFDEIVAELTAAEEGSVNQAGASGRGAEMSAAARAAERAQQDAGMRGADRELPPGAARGEERSERAQQEAEERIAAAERRAEEAEQRLAQQREEQAARRSAEQQAEAEARRNQPPSEKTYYTVAEVWENPRGLQRVRLDNGQVWEQLNSGGNFPLREGEQYFIEPRRFGGYSLGIDGSNRTMHVRQGN